MFYFRGFKKQKRADTDQETAVVGMCVCMYVCRVDITLALI